MRYCADCDAEISELGPNARRCHVCAHERRQTRNRRNARKYKRPTLKQKLGAMILLHLKIPHEQAKAMTLAKILSLVEWDHYPVPQNTAVKLGWDGHHVNHPSNLQPLTKADHLEKTRTIDTPQAAKAKRLVTAEQEHARRRMLAPGDRKNTPKRWPKGRKMESRPFQKKRKIDA